MNYAKVYKATAGALVSGAIGGLAGGSAIIPDGVPAPWWGYVIAFAVSGAVSAAVGFAGVYFAPANKPAAA